MAYKKVEAGSSDNAPYNNFSLGTLYSYPRGLDDGNATENSGALGLSLSGLDDGLLGKVESLLQFCFPNGPDVSIDDPATDLAQAFLTTDGIRHLAECYMSFHDHWPMLHTPTFKIAQADNSLMMAVLCIGAIYSPRLDADQTRILMDFVKTTVHRNCSIYTRYLAGQVQGLGLQSWEIEEFQALIIVQCMFTWHGDPQQRQAARSEFPLLVRLAQAMKLCESAPPGHYAYSKHHGIQDEHRSVADSSDWNWYSWLEQEKRNRALFLLFLGDAVLTMYFNCTPQFDPFQIRLSLPADDAAWDAKHSQACASALGLFGASEQSQNVTGTKRASQPRMREVMRGLLDPAAIFQPRATNIYSKFILVHALVARITACQRALAQPESHSQAFTSMLDHGSPRTPLAQHDWLEQRPGSGSLSASSSGVATPTQGVGPQNIALQQERKRLMYALDKWKRCWDADLEMQYPPAQTRLRRFGFSRDGVHFFYLGRSFLQSMRAADWSAPADLRFQQVMTLLRRIKSFVVGENDGGAHDIGSVSDIDELYGRDTLTLDSMFDITSL